MACSAAAESSLPSSSAASSWWRPPLRRLFNGAKPVASAGTAHARMSAQRVLTVAAAAVAAAATYGSEPIFKSWHRGAGAHYGAATTPSSESAAANRSGPRHDALPPNVPPQPPVTARVVEKAGRRVASRAGPHHIGIGWISSLAMQSAALLFAQACITGFVWLLATNSHVLTLTCMSVVAAFATNPNESSFLEWSKRQAPYIAAKKEGFDALRTRLAPYLLRFQDWEYFDFQLCSIVRVRDFADYVYIYVGVLGKWYLLGWYLDAAADDARWLE